MSDLSDIRALTFDTGGTVLDWHSGFRDALAAAGRRHGIDRDWAALANDLRRRSMASMADATASDRVDFDTAHRDALDDLITAESLEAFDADDRHAIAWTAPHGFIAWPDVKDGLARMREHRIAVSFTLLTYRLVIDTGRANGLVWDAVLSCEGLPANKPAPEAYRAAAAMLRLSPEQCLMVACHPFDLDAARAVGFRTALVRRPKEWGDAPSDVPPAGTYDIEVGDFHALASAMPVVRGQDG